MKIDFKNIHLGDLLRKIVEKEKIPIQRVCNFMNCSEFEIQQMYQDESISTNLLLKWSKLLEYDFFRIYSQHLILYAPQKCIGLDSTTESDKKAIPRFKKNLYTQELIFFILELLRTNKKSATQIIHEYRIPRTTLYKWIQKYEVNNH